MDFIIGIIIITYFILTAVGTLAGNITNESKSYRDYGGR
jgi:hypothetical protein